MALRERIEVYVTKARTYRAGRFIAEGALWTLVPKAPLALFLALSFILAPGAEWLLSCGESGRPSWTTTEWFLGYLSVIVWGVLFAPLIETLLFQFLPIYFGLKFVKKPIILILFSGVLFGVIHLDSIIIRSAVGIVLATAFYLWKDRSLLAAFLVTAAIHGITNVFNLGIDLLVNPELCTVQHYLNL